MSASTINSYSRFSDSLERELIVRAAQENRAYSIVEGLSIVSNFIGRAASAVGHYLVQVAEVINEARALNARYSRSQW